MVHTVNLNKHNMTWHCNIGNNERSYSWTHKDIFLGGEFLMKYVSINTLWWLALAIMLNAAFSHFPCVSMKVVDWVSPSSTGDYLCVSDWIVLFSMPDRFIWVMLSLTRGSTSILTSLSSRFVSDVDGSEAITWFAWLCGTSMSLIVWLAGGFV